jgi:hypothetical protein
MIWQPDGHHGRVSLSVARQSEPSDTFTSTGLSAPADRNVISDTYPLHSGRPGVS